MKSYIRLVSIVVLCCFFLNSTLLFAQIGPEKELDPLATELKPLKSEVLKAEILSRDFVELLKVDEEIKGLYAHITKMGYAAQKGEKNFWGIRETYLDEDKEVTYTVRIQDYTKRDSKDVAAIGQVTISTIDMSETYSFYLEAPGGDFGKVVEYSIDKELRILKADSLWSCIQKYLKERCSSVCIDAIGKTCPGFWAAYFLCASRVCGGCFVKAVLCCACDCTWWCKRVVGCCDR